MKTPGQVAHECWWLRMYGARYIEQKCGLEAMKEIIADEWRLSQRQEDWEAVAAAVLDAAKSAA